MVRKIPLPLDLQMDVKRFKCNQYLMLFFFPKNTESVYKQQLHGEMIIVIIFIHRNKVLQ